MKMDASGKSRLVLRRNAKEQMSSSSVHFTGEPTVRLPLTICAAIGVMLLSLTAFCLLLHTSSPELAREAVIFRQSQLADAVLADDRQAMLVAIDAHANLNSPIVLTAERLTALAKVSSRLDHYFREETKATPLILAAALGEKEICSLLVERR